MCYGCFEEVDMPMTPEQENALLNARVAIRMSEGLVNLEEIKALFSALYSFPEALNEGDANAVVNFLNVSPKGWRDEIPAHQMQTLWPYILKFSRDKLDDNIKAELTERMDELPPLKGTETKKKNKISTQSVHPENNVIEQTESKSSWLNSASEFFGFSNKGRGSYTPVNNPSRVVPETAERQSVQDLSTNGAENTQHEKEKIDRKTAFVQGREGFFNLISPSSLSEYETVGNNLFAAFNGAGVMKFRERCNIFFEEFNSHTADFERNRHLRSIVYVLMSCKEADEVIENDVKTFGAHGTLFGILSKGQNFTPNDRIQLIEFLFEYVNNISNKQKDIEQSTKDIEQSTQDKALRFIDNQIELIGNADKSTMEALYSTLTGSDVPQCLVAILKGRAENFSHHASDTPREKAFTEGKTAFFVSQPFNKNVSTNNDIVKSLKQALNHAGQDKFVDRIRKFFTAFETEGKSYDDNFRRIVTVLMNADKELTDFDLGKPPGNLWNILSGISLDSKKEQQIDERFSPKERIQLVQFLFDYLRTEQNADQPLNQELQRKAMKFIQNQVAAFRLQGGDIKYMLPTLFREDNFRFLRQSMNSQNEQTKAFTKNVLTECFSVVLHDSLHDAGREEDWLVVAKAAGFDNWGKEEILPNKPKELHLLNEEWQAIQTIAADDKAETDINNKYKDAIFNNYFAIKGQLNRLYPKGNFNWLGAFFRTIAYDTGLDKLLGFKAMPKPAYESVINLENLVIPQVVTGGVSHTSTANMGPISTNVENGAHCQDNLLEDSVLTVTHTAESNNSIINLSASSTEYNFLNFIKTKTAEEIVDFYKTLSTKTEPTKSNFSNDCCGKILKDFFMELWKSLGDQKKDFVANLNEDNLNKLTLYFKVKSNLLKKSNREDFYADDRKIVEDEIKKREESFQTQHTVQYKR